MNKILFGMLALVLVGAGCSTALTGTPAGGGDGEGADVMIVDHEAPAESDEAGTDSSEVGQGGGDDIARSSAQYIDYSEGNFDAQITDQPTVLFFHAAWCPTCRSAESDIEKNIDDLPEGLTIVKVDYDSSRKLRAKYGVTVQHTYVQIDENGNEIKKWIGGGVALINQQLQ